MSVSDIDLRVRQAELARLWKVSKQAINNYVRRGIISVDPDGLIPPKRALREYLANTDGARMRAEVMRTITSEVDDLKIANKGISEELTRTRHTLRLALQMLAEQSAWLQRFFELADANINRFRDTSTDGDCSGLMDQLFEQAGEYALGLDAGEVLPRIDDDLAAYWAKMQLPDS